MNHTIKTRIKAAALAAMMLLTSVPVSAFTAVTAYAADNPTISYPPQYVTTDPKSAYVITGNTITIDESIPPTGGFMYQGLNISFDNGGTQVPLTNPSNSGIYYDDTTSGRKTITIDGAFNPSTASKGASTSAMETESEEGAYSVTARYYSLQAVGTYRMSIDSSGSTSKDPEEEGGGSKDPEEGGGSKDPEEGGGSKDPEESGGPGGSEMPLEDNDPTEPTPPTTPGTPTITTTPTTSSSLGEVVASRETPILANSTITIKVTGNETAGGSPQFSVSKKGTGSLTDFTTGSKVDVITADTTRPTHQEEEPAGPWTRTLSLRLSNSTATGNTSYPLTLNFTISNLNAVTRTTTDENGQPVTEVIEWNNYLLDGTIFEVEFIMPTSNSLLMHIITPQKAIELVEKAISNDDGENDRSFVELANQNSWNYITDNFQLRRLTNQFNGSFRIDWSWVPDNLTEAEKKEGITEEAKKNAVRIPSVGSDKVTATVRPLKIDITGQLIATVYYNRLNGDPLPSNSKNLGKTIPIKKLTIRGLGDPANVKEVNERIGKQNGPQDNNLKNKELSHSTAKDMDAYEGGITEYNYSAKNPYQYDLTLNMGAKNGAAKFARVTLEGDTDAVVLETRQGAENFAAYNPGDDINNNQFGINENSDPGYADLRIIAQPLSSDSNPKTVKVTISFFIPDRAGTPQESPTTTFTIDITVRDGTPSRDSSLKSLVIRDQDGNIINYPFSPGNLKYTGSAGTIHIPYEAHSITITPTLNDPRGAGNSIWMSMRDSMNQDVELKGHTYDSGAAGPGVKLKNGEQSKKIPFYPTKDSDTYDRRMEVVGNVYSVFVVAPSQDPRARYWSTYQLDIVRDPPSTDNTMGALEIYLEDAEPIEGNNLVVNFKPDVNEYEVWIPYSTDKLRVRAKTNDPNARWISEKDGKKDILRVKGLPDYKLDSLTKGDPNKEWLKDVKGNFKQLPPNSPMDLIFEIVSQKSWVQGDSEKGTYTVHIYRLDPSNDAFMSSFIVTDNDENELTYTPTFRPDTNTYTLNIPYSISKIKFNINTNDPNVSAVEVWELNSSFGVHNGTKKLSLNDSDAAKALQLGVLSRGVDVWDVTDDRVRNREGYHPFYIYIKPESEEEKYAQEYHLRVRREEPSHDAKLIDLLLKDQANAEINTFAFHPDETEYHIKVPYSTTGVSFTPTTSHQYATVEIQESGLLSGLVGTLFPYTIESGATSKVFQLLNEPEKEKEFRVVVRAEDYSVEKKTGTEIIYYVYVSREPPSSDARLKSLVTQNTENFKPIFISSKTEYTADVLEGAPGVIIIPTANHPGATIRVDGVVVQSGQPTDLIELLEVTQTVRIEVIAEDGVTRMVYRITFTNWNLVEKTSNADLRRLTVNYGLMTPNFQSAVLNYEVTAKENAWSVDIIPKLADPLATMRVLNGTLELGDYNGNYAMAIADGQSTVNIEVTSPDKTVTKTYTVDIFRNEEDKLKNWTPLEAEDINFEQVSNPIIVKIEEYPRVGASVFNAIREEHPEMSIIFQGNDYSIRFDGANLTRVIPQTEIYDFRMTLTSPDEDAIYDIIASRSANNDIISDVVMLYFDYHGSLPGPATFSLSLGHRYGNDLLYWHYYNKERDRIDYYGALESNSQGNIAVSIDHFSTYLVSPEHRIAGSEDKDGVVDELGMVSNGQDLLGSGGKLNPNTGAGAAARPMATNESRVFPSFVSRPDVYIRKKEDP